MTDRAAGGSAPGSRRVADRAPPHNRGIARSSRCAMLIAPPDSVRLFADSLLEVMAIRSGGARLYAVAAAPGADGGLNHYAMNARGDVLARGDVSLLESRVIDAAPELRLTTLTSIPFAQLGALWIAVCDAGLPEQGLYTLPELPPRWTPFTEVVREFLGGAAATPPGF
ncbi:MAG TPA: hypothetical protein VES00_08610 [Burkholderiaceae bacterium]|nr:hypothetical protein [Burkholderiaceae bacterium]